MHFHNTRLIRNISRTNDICVTEPVKNAYSATMIKTPRLALHNGANRHAIAVARKATLYPNVLRKTRYPVLNGM